jgi:APA family basic amino acid/polyamine antiporter
MVLAFVVILSVVPSVMAMIMVAPRLYEAMARDELFPAPLAARHPVTGAPARATAVLASLATIFAVAGTFEQIVAFFIGTSLIFLALAAAAVFVVRRRAAGADVFRAPGYPLTPVLFVLMVIAIVLLIAVNRPLQAVAGLALVLLGLPVRRLFIVERGGPAPQGKQP